MNEDIDKILSIAKNKLKDSVSNFLYYDRKGDEDFTRADIDTLCKHPEIIDELVAVFRIELERHSSVNIKQSGRSA